MPHGAGVGRRRPSAAASTARPARRGRAARLEWRSRGATAYRERAIPARSVPGRGQGYSVVSRYAVKPRRGRPARRRATGR